MANIKKKEGKKEIAKKSASREKRKVDNTLECGCYSPIDTVYDCGCVDTCMCC